MSLEYLLDHFLLESPYGDYPKFCFNLSRTLKPGSLNMQMNPVQVMQEVHLECWKQIQCVPFLINALTSATVQEVHKRTRRQNKNNSDSLSGSRSSQALIDILPVLTMTFSRHSPFTAARQWLLTPVTGRAD